MQPTAEREPAKHRCHHRSRSVPGSTPLPYSTQLSACLISLPARLSQRAPHEDADFDQVCNVLRGVEPCARLISEEGYAEGDRVGDAVEQACAPSSKLVSNRLWVERRSGGRGLHCRAHTLSSAWLSCLAEHCRSQLVLFHPSTHHTPVPPPAPAQPAWSAPLRSSAAAPAAIPESRPPAAPPQRRALRLAAALQARQGRALPLQRRRCGKGHAWLGLRPSQGHA